MVREKHGKLKKYITKTKQYPSFCFILPYKTVFSKAL